MPGPANRAGPAGEAVPLEPVSGPANRQEPAGGAVLLKPVESAFTPAAKVLPPLEGFVRVLNRTPGEGDRLFEPEGSAEGCASGECLPEEPAAPSDLPLSERWRAAVDSLKGQSPRYAKSLAFGRLVALRPGEVALAFPPEAAFHRATCFGSGRPAIEKALGLHFGVPTRLTEEALAPGAEPKSLAEEELKDRSDREKGIEAKVRAHPAVRAALRILGGELEHVQVLEQERAVAAEPEPES